MSQLTQLADGRYRLAGVLGSGAMGVVYRGWDQEAGAWRAIKLLSPIFARNEVIGARFRREAEALNRLAHPNIVAVHDFSEGSVGNTNQRFLVMDLAEGGSLMDWIRRHGPMPAGLAAQVALQVAGALAAAHAQGVVHRDIKPQNVLVSRGGICKVVDFGIARFSDGADNLTRTNVRMGSLGYMAPEQQQSARDVDARADVYAAGATLLALLNGRAPHDLSVALEDCQGVPHPLAMVVMRATLTDREKRYADGAALARALERAMEAAPATPSVESAPLFTAVHPSPAPPEDATETLGFGD